MRSFGMVMDRGFAPVTIFEDDAVSDWAIVRSRAAFRLVLKSIRCRKAPATSSGSAAESGCRSRRFQGQNGTLMNSTG
jgi:hypothetical protein